jgi:EAL domain-containing protein (putative c-di-GMP-specific phosphodiesterase class I)
VPNPHLLKIELTEYFAGSTVEDIIAKMTGSKSHRCGAALDDFGTG